MSLDLRPVRRALLSASDKTGLVPFASALHARGVALVSTGGTAAALAGAGLPVTDVAAVTGFPEMMDGRVKTLHPAIHGGLLAVRSDEAHAAALARHGIEPIDLLVANLYPFEAAVASGRPYEDCVEQIDVGGPAMIRAAAKNHADVAVVTDPEDYAAVEAELVAHDGATTGALRRRLAAEAFARTAAYDAAISGWLAKAVGGAPLRHRAFGGRLAAATRYGENPHQAGAFYRTGDGRPGVATARQVGGKELSYNNLADVDAAYECVAEFDGARTAAVVIVKHANPCGVAEGASLAEAYERALRCDPTSAFGGVVALNRTLDAEAARRITAIFTEAIVAPDAEPEAIAIVGAKRNLRLLLAGGPPDPGAPGLAVRSVAGGLLLQDRDDAVADAVELRVVTRRAPSERELADLRFAWRVAKHVKSNAIVYARDRATVGIGAGQMSRVDAARIAAAKAADAAAAAGATAAIQPGGSVRDAEVIAAADEAGLAMVFTGVRHFRH